MNQALDLATGDYCIFINCGDAFYDDNVLEAIIPYLESANDVIYGDALVSYHSQKAIWESNIDKIKEKMPFCHQSCFVKTPILKELRFDDHFRIAADYDVILRLFLAGYSFVNSKLIISRYELTGLSSTNYTERIKEKYEVRYKNRIIGINYHKSISYIKDLGVEVIKQGIDNLLPSTIREMLKRMYIRQKYNPNTSKNKYCVLYDYQILHRQIYGGISRYHYELYNHLNKTEINTYVLSLNSQNYYFDKPLLIKPYGPLKKYSLRLINFLASYIWLLKNSNSKLIIHPTYYIFYFHFAQRRGAKLVVTVHDMIHELFPDNHLGQNRIIKNKKKCIYKADKIIAVSENTKKDILQVYPDISPSKISVIYHGFSRPTTQTAHNYLTPNNPYILFVGNRKGYKNFNIIINSASILHTQIENLKIYCVGGGKFEMTELEAMDKYKCRNMFIQLNATDNELYSLYHDALCLVFPSKYEGFGIPILESFSVGTPAVLSNSSCFPEIALDAALYFENNDVASLANQIIKLYKNPTLRTQLSEKALKRASEFSWEKCARETKQIYDSCYK